jgi:hypothetical protein
MGHDSQTRKQYAFKTSVFLTLTALQSSVMIFIPNIQEIHKSPNHYRQHKGKKGKDMKAQSDLYPSPKQGINQTKRERILHEKERLYDCISESHLLCCHCAAKREKSEPINKLMLLMYTYLNEKRTVGFQRNADCMREWGLYERMHCVVVSNGT